MPVAMAALRQRRATASATPQPCASSGFERRTRATRSTQPKRLIAKTMRTETRHEDVDGEARAGFDAADEPNGKMPDADVATQIANGAAMTTMAPACAVVSLTIWALVTPSDERIERSSFPSRV